MREWKRKELTIVLDLSYLIKSAVCVLLQAFPLAGPIHL